MTIVLLLAGVIFALGAAFLGWLSTTGYEADRLGSWAVGAAVIALLSFAAAAFASRAR